MYVYMYMYVTDLLVKANLFNDFRGQFRPITNDSSLPNNQTIETITRLLTLTLTPILLLNLFVN